MRYISFFCFFCLLGCAAVTRNKINRQQDVRPLQINGKLFTALYQQQAAEYKALCFQSYQLATWRLADLSPSNTRPLAIVTDIDETVLDNSAYAVHRGLQGLDYDLKSWMEWTARAEADTICGAPSFLKWASSKGIEIFYITNREEAERVGTLKNLQKFNLPFTDDKHLILKGDRSSKELRRKKVAADYDIVLYIGDNLADFSDMFDKKPPKARTSNVQLVSSLFGSQFIVIPNPVYGDWEGALFNYQYSLTPAQKDSVYRSVLKGH